MKQHIPTSIRLNETIYERIKEEAQKEKRSITAQIEYNLEKYYEIVDRIVPRNNVIEKAEKDVG